MFFSLPLDAGRRLPQSVQKIKEPIAAMVLLLLSVVCCYRLLISTLEKFLVGIASQNGWFSSAHVKSFSGALSIPPQAGKHEPSRTPGTWRRKRVGCLLFGLAVQGYSASVDLHPTPTTISDNSR